MRSQEYVPPFVVIEDTRLLNESIGSSIIHYLDHGDFIRTTEDWMRLVGPLLEVEESEGFSSGFCDYSLIVGRVPEERD